MVGINVKRRITFARSYSIMHGWVFFLCLGSLMAVGCKVGPNFQRPSVCLQENWAEHPQSLEPQEASNLACWWTQLNSPELDLIIEQVVTCNLSVNEAAHRIQEARALQRATIAGLAPNAFGTGSTLYKQFSQSGNAFIPQSNAFQLHSLGFDASWELDLWGRVKRLNEAAIADQKAAIEAHRNLIVTLSAEAARTFVEARTVQARLAIAERNLETQWDTVLLAESQEAAGLVSHLDVTQARAAFHDTEATVPLLRQQLTQACTRLCVLQGLPPLADSYAQLGVGSIPEIPGHVAAGVPQDLLRRRPDVRQAEQALIAENARIGVAIADLYPQLTLNGTLSVDSRDVTNLFTGESLAHSIGPSVRWNFLSFGRVRGKINAQEERYLQSVAKYRQTVLLAAEETINALVSLEEEQQRREALFNSTLASQQSVQMAKDQYRSGLVNFQTVLEAQRQLLKAEDQLATSHGQAVTNFVKVYKSLGGGWQCPGDVCIIERVEVAERPMPAQPVMLGPSSTIMR